MTTLLVELRNALDRRWRRDRTLRLGILLALALLCGGAALFRWIEFLGARPVSSTLLDRQDSRKNRVRVRTLVFDQGALELEIRPTYRLTPALRRLGAISHEILDVRRGDPVVLWVGPLGTFTPVPRAPILSTLAAIILFLTAIALRSTRHPRALALDRWTSGPPPGWIESTSHESDGGTVHRLARPHPWRHGLATCLLLSAIMAAFPIFILGLTAGFLGERPELRLLAMAFPPLAGLTTWLLLPLELRCRTVVRFHPEHLGIDACRVPWTSIREVILRAGRNVPDLQILTDGPSCSVLLNLDALLWVGGLLEGRGIPVRLETD